VHLTDAVARARAATTPIADLNRPR